MALLKSQNIPLGKKAKEFNLTNCLDDKTYSLNSLKKDKATVIMFICNHCPYVKHIFDKIVEVAKKYNKSDVAFIGINANDVDAYPEDSPEVMKNLMLKHHNPFIYLFDDTQNVAKEYGAICTPEFFVYDKDLLCVYHGQFDDSRPGNNIPPSGSDLSSAIDALLNNKPIDQNQKPSIGCSIKWK